MNSTNGISRRDALRAFGASAAVALLGACGSSAQPAGSASGQPASVSSSPQASVSQPQSSASSPAEQPRAGGTMKMGLVGDLKNLEPHQNNPGSYTVLYPIHDRLTEYDDNLKVVPSLAESWDISTDQKQYKLNLRKDVQFHTGRPFTSDDVTFNITRASSPKTGQGQLAQSASLFTSMQTPDKNTAILSMDQPQNIAFDLFYAMNIVDKETIQGPDAKKKVVGTGPFSFVEWVQGDHITLAKNKNYWVAGRPYLDGMIYQIVKDGQAELVAFESGVLDVVDGPPYQDVSRLQKDSKYTVTPGSPSGAFVMNFNVTQPPLDNQKVRQALSYALDRKRIADTVWLGFAEPGDLPWNSTSPAYDATKNALYTFDLNRAKAMLSEAGVSNLGLDFDYQSSQPDYATAAQIYQADLAKIGVKLNVKVVDPATFGDLATKHTYQGIAGDRFGYNSVQPHALILQNAASTTVGNRAGYENPKYTQIVQAMAMEFDPSKYKQLASQLNDLLLDASAMISLAVVQTVLVTQAKAHGVRHTYGSHLNISDAWLG